MKNKGFTLVEIIGVITLIAVISLLVMPPIINQINKKKAEMTNSLEQQVYAGATLYANDNVSLMEYTTCVKLSTLVSGDYLDSSIYSYAKTDNRFNEDAYVKIINDKQNADGSNHYTYELTDTCGIPYTDPILNGADPILVDGMIPVNIADDGTVTKADIYNGWYNYTNKEWANMVLVTSGTRQQYINANPGVKITLDDILGYYVWIPRYKYAITSGTGSRLINVVFENKNTAKSTGTAIGTDYLTHPGFTFGTEELNGFWFAKFETSGTLDNPLVLPNQTSLKELKVNKEYNSSLLFKTSTYINGNIDAHMVMNKEWGSVAYLVNSIYGRCADTTCTEVSINNRFVTGNSAGRPGDTTTGSDVTYTYNTTEGYTASTTGNISGIYDMSGGAWENVMGVYKTSSGTPYSGYDSNWNSGFNGTYGHVSGSLTTGDSFPASKYYQTYSGTSSATGCNGGICYGDALSETLSWNGDLDQDITAVEPWYGRGGSAGYNSMGGIFSYSFTIDSQYDDTNGYRSVLIP